MDPDISVVVVSGGSRGLGQSLVSYLLGRGHTALTFSRAATPFVEECRRAHPDRFHWEPVDARDGEALRGFIHAMVKRFGRIDVLVNNAGAAVEGVLPLMLPGDVSRVLALNLEAAIILAQLCSRAMLRQRHGLIINVSSIVGLRGYAGLSVYSASKAGLDGLTRSLARELGPAGIRVNSIAPGYLDTEMSSSLGVEQRRQIVRRTPLGRLGSADDVVGMVGFLMSPAASFITGQTLVIDGGLTC